MERAKGWEFLFWCQEARLFQACLDCACCQRAPEKLLLFSYLFIYYSYFIIVIYFIQTLTPTHVLRYFGWIVNVCSKRNVWTCILKICIGEREKVRERTNYFLQIVYSYSMLNYLPLNNLANSCSPGLPSFWLVMNLWVRNVLPKVTRCTNRTCYLLNEPY